MSSTFSPTFSKLNAFNYPTWVDNMEAWLMSSGLWRIVSGVSTRPTPSNPATEANTALVEDWDIKSQKAAGSIFLMVEDNQKIHFNGIKGNPVKMWAKLKDVYLQQKPGARFNAYDYLFSIRKQEDEPHQAYINRVEEALKHIQDLRPADFTLANLDDELASMALIRGLPSEEYSAFISHLLLLDKLEKSTVHQALITEELQRQRRAGDIPSSSQALSVTSGKPIKCDFCSMNNHTMDKCFAFERAKKQAHENATKPRRFRQANKAQEYSSTTPTPTSTTPLPKQETAQSTIAEFAGNASALPTGLSDPLQLNADFDWTADTGATSHMTPHAHWLRNYQPLSIPIKLADHTVVMSAGVGTVVFNPVVRGKQSRPVEFTRVLHVPALRNNLLSCLYLTRQKGMTMVVGSEHMDFFKNGTLLFQATITSNNIGTLDGVVVPADVSQSARLAPTLPLDLNLWHRRLAHHSYADVKKMINQKLVTGLDLQSKQHPDPICEPCLAGKMHSNPFPTSSSHSSAPLELIHSDLHGPVKKETHSGYKYWITFIDDYSRFRVVYPLKSKSGAFDAFRTFKAYAENHHGTKIKALQDDKGGEYMSNAFIKFTTECGIIRRHTTRNRPQQNGIAERANRTLAEDITSMLNESKLPVQFWGEGLIAQVHVWNCLPTAILPNTTPYELWHNKKPDVSHLRIWGCTAYVFVQKDQRSSFQPHYQKCVFIGYPDGYKGWKFYNPTTKKVVISERAEFDERYFPGLSRSLGHIPLDVLLPDPPLHSSELLPMPVEGGDDIIQPPLAPTFHPSPTPSTSSGWFSPDPSLPRQSTPPPLSQSPPHTPTYHSDTPAVPPPLGRHQRFFTTPHGTEHTILRSSRVSKPPAKYPAPEVPVSHDPGEDNEEDFQQGDFAASASVSEPRTFRQAMSSPDSDKWSEAATLEYNTLVENGTWEIVELPAGKQAIGSRWVWKVKHNSDGTIERYKARVVAKGYLQCPGFDYTDVFAPTYRPAALRLVLALAALKDLELRSVDISSAFTYGDLDEEIYMEQPEGFHQGGPNMVCKLKKGLYGLKQASRQWNKKIHSVLVSIGFTRIKADAAIYVYSKGNVRIIVPIFIDDITFAGNSKAEIDSCIQELSNHFKLRDLGDTKFLLGIEISRDRSKHSISLSQKQYILNILERFGHSNCATVQTPMNSGLVLTKEDSAKTEKEKAEIPYLEAVGALQYLSLHTRPDIAYAVGYLGRFNHCYGDSHWKAVKHVFRYLKGTLDYTLTYQGPLAPHIFSTYSDASHMDSFDTGKSTGGYLTIIGGGAIGWSSKLQDFVSLSTTEAEYVAAVEAGKEILWMRHILDEFGYSVNGASPLLMDNQSALSVSKNPEHHGRMKHLRARYFWLRDEVDANTIQPLYIQTDEQLADMLTKALSPLKIRNFCGKIGLQRTCQVKGEC
jgi:transposase InsO family protein